MAGLSQLPLAWSSWLRTAIIVALYCLQLYCACIAQSSGRTRVRSLSGVNRRLPNSNAIHATQQLPWLCAAFADDEQGTSRSCQHHNHDRNGSHGNTRIRKGAAPLAAGFIRGSATGLSSVARIVGIAGLLLSRAGSDLRGRTVTSNVAFTPR